MILEELIGSCVAVVSTLILQTPPILRENVPAEEPLIYEDSHEDDQEYDGVIHREYEQSEANTTPSYENGLSVKPQTEKPKRWESFRRSFIANVGILLAVVFILSMFTAALVVDSLKSITSCVYFYVPS